MQTFDGQKDAMLNKFERFVEGQEGKHGAQVDGVIGQVDTAIDGYQAKDAYNDNVGKFFK